MTASKSALGLIFPNAWKHPKGGIAMCKKDKYNSSGCLDMTAYLALRNVEREERRLQIQKDKQSKQLQKRHTGGKHGNK